MRSTFRVDLRDMLGFALRIIGLLAVLNLVILLILWALRMPFLFTITLVYEGFFLMFLGVLQILGSYIYREDSITYRQGFRTGWFDFRKFARLKPEERVKSRQEGMIMVAIGLVLLAGIAVVKLYLFAIS